MNLNNAHVLVTGANRGLGKALVAEFLKTGIDTLYAAARNPSDIQLNDPRIQPVQLDVTDPLSVTKLAASIGHLDLLINNAGAIEFGDILTAGEAEMDRCFDVNVKGVWRVSQAFTPLLARSERGGLCNILSLLSLASMPGLAAYNLSKAAAWSATLSLRATLSSQNVAVYSVFPGAIDTDMIASVEMEKADPLAVARAIIAGITAGEEDIFPAEAWKQVYAAWRTDHKSVEREFGRM